MAISVCETIRCPYWSNNHKTSYGCQRWPLASACHLKFTHPELEDNEYALFSESFDPQTLANENKAFFLEDTKYLQDVKLQKELPDWGIPFPTHELL
jgi:hypothetical protein